MTHENRMPGIRVGVIGCGRIAEDHVLGLLRHRDVAVVACADVRIAAAERFADRFRIPHFGVDGGGLLRRHDIDAVVICMPPKWHAEYAIQALGEGKHVLIEKPLAMNLAEADGIVDAALAGDRVVGVAFVHRYVPAYRALARLVRAGAIGRVRQARLRLGTSMYRDSRFARPHSDPRSWLVDPDVAGGGILMASTGHHLSVLTHLLGDVKATRVTARVRHLHPRAFFGIEDDVDLWVDLEGGGELVVHDSWATDEPCVVGLAGECGQLTAQGPTWTKLTLLGGGDGFALAAAGDAEAPKPGELPAASAADIGRRIFFDLADDFLESVRRGRPVPSLPDVLHARNIQAILTAAYRSGRDPAANTVDWRDGPAAIASP